jgi:hypothetical protein
MVITPTEQLLNTSRAEIIELISKTFSVVTHDKFDYKSGWLIFEAASQDILKDFLSKKFPKAKIRKAEGKNEYPDVTLETEDGKFAIDIKASANEKDPEFDIARIDTMIKSRINVFKEEWEIVIKYEKKSGKLVDVYFTLLREIVGVHKLSGGIKYRLYDGKVRPKSWKDFDGNKIYWATKENFIKGIKMSFDYRWTALISNHLVPNLNKEEKAGYIKLFENPIHLEEDLEDEDEDGNEESE